MTTTTTTTTTRPTLAELNEKHRKNGIMRNGYTLTYELRVGRWGVEYTHVGRSRGQGGKLRHLMKVNVIEAMPEDFDAKANCLQNGPPYLRKYAQSQHPWEQKLVHGGKDHSVCYANKVGDTFDAWPVCRDSNVGTRGAFEPEQADTDLIDCVMCLRGFFHEDTPGREQMDAERKAALAALPAKVNCSLCDREQKRQFISDGMCSTCASLVNHDIAWYEKTGRELHESHVSQNHDAREAQYLAANPNAFPSYDRCEAESERYLTAAAKARAKRDRLAIKGAKSRAARGVA